MQQIVFWINERKGNIMDSNDFREMTFKIWRTDNLGENRLKEEKNFNYVHNIIKRILKNIIISLSQYTKVILKAIRWCH